MKNMETWTLMHICAFENIFLYVGNAYLYSAIYWQAANHNWLFFSIYFRCHFCLNYYRLWTSTINVFRQQPTFWALIVVNNYSFYFKVAYYNMPQSIIEYVLITDMLLYRELAKFALNRNWWHFKVNWA